MDNTFRTIFMGAAGAGEATVDVSDVFSNYVYTGNGGTQTITNGIDLSGEGGLVWVKRRSVSFSHVLSDTANGGGKYLSSNLTDSISTTTSDINAFNSDGFTIGSSNGVNTSGQTYVSWTFRKAPKFFDVVTYTGDGVAGRTVAHNLGQEVGMLVVKKTSGTGFWPVFHRANTSAPETDVLILNEIYSTTDGVTFWNDTLPTDVDFTVGTADNTNASGETYVAYLFAHDTDPDEGMIQCGSYTGTGYGGQHEGDAC